MAAEIDVAKQVAYALLSGPGGFEVTKQVAYAELAYPQIDLAKQVSYAELAQPGPQIAKQVVYGLLRGYGPQLFAADLTGEGMLLAAFTDPSARFAADLIGEGQLGLDLARHPPFDCTPESVTFWSVEASPVKVWTLQSDAPTPWTCAADEPDLHNNVLTTLAGNFLTTLGGKRLRLISQPSPTPTPTPSPAIPPPDSVAIANPTELFATLNPGVVVAGGRNYLLAGVPFGDVYLANLDFSADPIVISGQPGTTMGYLVCDTCKGITWKDFDTVSLAGYSTGATVWALGCTNVTFDGVNSKSGVGGGIGSEVGGGLQVIGGSHIAYRNAEIQGRASGIGITDADFVTIEANDLHDIAVDGIYFAGVRDLLIARNTGYDFWPDLVGGDHPDFIQGFNSATRTNERVTIVGNGWMRGAGEGAQGIFIGDGVNDSFTIRDNWICGGGFANGIVLFNGIDAVIENNFVQGDAAVPKKIQIGGLTNATVTGNAANYYGESSVNPGLVDTPNTTIGPRENGDYADLDAFIARTPNAARRPI